MMISPKSTLGLENLFGPKAQLEIFHPNQPIDSGLNLPRAFSASRLHSCAIFKRIFWLNVAGFGFDTCFACFLRCDAMREACMNGLG